MAAFHPFLPLRLRYTASRGMAASSSLRAEDGISSQTVRDGLSELPGGFVSLGRIPGRQIASDALAHQPDGQISEGSNFLPVEPSPATPVIVGWILESHSSVMVQKANRWPEARRQNL